MIFVKLINFEFFLSCDLFIIMNLLLINLKMILQLIQVSISCYHLVIMLTMKKKDIE